MKKKIPETKEEWIVYSQKQDRLKKRLIPVVEISLENIEEMWNYEYQAKYFVVTNGSAKLKTVLASNSLNKLKQEVKRRKFKIVYLTTSKGSLSFGQNAVEEYPYQPRY